MHLCANPHPNPNPHPHPNPNPNPTPKPKQVQRGELDLELLYAWLGALLRARGEDLFRMKGVLSLNEDELRQVTW